MSCNILKNNTITDKDFLETMIIHHKVAIDMSKLIINSSTNDAILSIARNIIFNQTKEIYFMKTLSIEINYSINEGVTTNKPFRNTFKLDYPTIFDFLILNIYFYILSIYFYNYFLQFYMLDVF